MSPLPPLMPSVGVKIAVRNKPVPVTGPNVPPVTDRIGGIIGSPMVSLNENVIVAVCPFLSVVSPTSEVIEMVGAVVSIVTCVGADRRLLLPAASTCFTEI